MLTIYTKLTNIQKYNKKTYSHTNKLQIYANSCQLSLINTKHNNKRINYNNKSNNNKKN